MDTDLLVLVGVAVAGMVFLASKAKVVPDGGPGITGSQGGEPSGATEGPANRQAGVAFNFNDLDTTASYSEHTGIISAHAGFGHVGPGGTYTLRIDVGNTGAFGIIGTQPWQSADAVQLQIGDDADWAGYGYDFQVHFDRTFIGGMEVRFGIYTDTNALVQQKVIGVGWGL